MCAESRESIRVREKRGKVTRASSLDFNSDVTQDLDANDGEQRPPDLQPSFLSESVRKYLELGELARSIPGKFCFTIKNLRSKSNNQFLFLLRATGNGLSHIGSRTIHKFLLWWTTISGVLCWYGNKMPRFVLMS